MRVRACDCTFCSRHGGSWTSHPEAELAVSIEDSSLASTYRFGTSTADFHVCARCGVVPAVTSRVEGFLFAVVNANTFEDLDPRTLARASAHFEDESTGERLARRTRNWISKLSVKHSTDS